MLGYLQNVKMLAIIRRDDAGEEGKFSIFFTIKKSFLFVSSTLCPLLN